MGWPGGVYSTASSAVHAGQKLDAISRLSTVCIGQMSYSMLFSAPYELARL